MSQSAPAHCPSLLRFFQLIEFQVYLSNTLMLFVYPECCYLNCAIFFAMRSEINGRLRIRIHRYLDAAVIPFLKKNFMTFNSIG